MANFRVGQEVWIKVIDEDEWVLRFATPFAIVNGYGNFIVDRVSELSLVLHGDQDAQVFRSIEAVFEQPPALNSPQDMDALYG